MKRLIIFLFLVQSALGQGNPFPITNGKLTTDLNANSNKVTNLLTPTNSGDAASKGYVDSSVSGGVPTSRTLTINGTTFDLTANRTWTVGDALVANPLSQFAATTSLQLAGVISDETGTGSLVFGASPTLSGVPLAPTAAADTNTTQLATTAFVLGQAGAANPLIAGTAAPGTSLRYSRQDHVHPPQTSVTGNAGTATALQTARTLAGNSFDGTANVPFANAFIVQGTADAGLTGAQFLGALGTGILKNTTTTGVLSIAVAGDFPILNQNTTGNAATVTTNANLTGDVTSVGNATTTVNLPDGVTQAGSLLVTDIAAPSSPSAAHLKVFGDSTDLRFHDKNAAGTIGTTVVADTGATNNFLTAISASGVISKSQPTPTNVGLGNVTNDAQTKAAIVPNTAPAAGQILAGNAGGTAYAPVTLSGSGATATLSSAGVLTLSAISNSTLSNSAITIAGTSTSLGGSITVDTITGVSSNGFVKRTGANTYTNIADPLPLANGGTGGTTDSGGWSIVQLTADATTTSTTSVDIAGATGPTLVTPTLANSTLYEFEANLYVVNAADTTGMKFGSRTIAGTGAATTTMVMGLTSSSGVATSGFTGVGSAVAGTAFDIVSGQVGYIKIWGFYLTGSTGTPVIASTFAKVTSNTATVKSGSILRWRIMGQ